MIRVIHYHPLTTRLPVVRPDQVRHGMGLRLAGGVRLGVEVHHGVGPLPPGVEELLQDGVPEDQLPHAVDEELRLSPELLSSVRGGADVVATSPPDTNQAHTHELLGRGRPEAQQSNGQIV